MADGDTDSDDPTDQSGHQLRRELVDAPSVVGARTLDVSKRSAASFVPLDFTASLDASAMAIDGFHPGPPAYAAWAARIAAAIDIAR